MTRPLLSWAGGVILGLGALTLHAAAQAPVRGQVSPQVEVCLHDNRETSAEKERRTEALAAMRMIGYVVSRTPAVPLRTGWQRLASSHLVGELRAMDGPVGDLARKIAWGDREPLPGWRITWVQVPATLHDPTTVFGLTDDRDPCRFKYRSNDPEVAGEMGRGGMRLLPLDTD